MKSIIENDVSVGTAKAKGIDRNSAQTLVWPRNTLDWNLRGRKISEILVSSKRFILYMDFKKFHVNGGIDFLKQSIGWNYSLFQDH